jgi:KDO2-lipid IV(A) lauroyltransferase
LQQQGDGVVIIAPHLGNWEYLGLFLGAHYDCVSLYKPGKYAVVNAVVRRGRSRSGANLMPTDKKGVMAVLKKLKAGSVSGILPDQVPEEANSRVMADFMGHPAPTMTLVSSLVKKPNIKAVAAFAKRLPSGKFELIFQAVDDAIYSADTEVSAAALNKAVENLLAEAPMQYQWEYKRFKYDAAGGKNPLYKKRPA